MPRLVATLQAHRVSRDSWAVAHLRVEEGDMPAGELITAVGGMLGRAEPGERLELEGSWDQHHTYGPQFKVAKQASLGIQSVDGARSWLCRLDGVGPVLAARLEAAFGEGLVSVLRSPPEGEEDPLLRVEGIGKVLLRTIRESWEGVGAFGKPEDLAYLSGLGLTRWESDNVIDEAGKRRMGAQELLESEPYSLVERKGLGFKRVDRIALAAGIGKQSPARADAAVVFFVGELCQADTMVQAARLVAEANRATACGPSVLVDGVRRVCGSARVAQTREAGVRWLHPAGLAAAELEIAEFVGEPEEDTLEAEIERRERALGRKLQHGELVEVLWDSDPLSGEPWS